MTKYISISAFSNTSGKQIFTKSFNANVEVKLVEQYHANNTRLAVKDPESGVVIFTFDFNEQQVSIVQDKVEV